MILHWLQRDPPDPEPELPDRPANQRPDPEDGEGTDDREPAPEPASEEAK